MSLKNSRRHFLTRSLQSLAVAGFADQLFEALFMRLTSTAFAEALAPNPSGYYFHLSLATAPPRWLFDLPLTPMGSSAATFKQGGTNSFGTGLEKVSGLTRVIYNPVKKNLGGKQVWLPPVWSFNTSKDFSTLLPHTLFVRGMDMEINSHGGSNQRQVSPIIGGYSISGMVADRSQRPLPSITDSGSGSAQGFKSKKGLNASPVTTTSLTANLMTSLLTSFKAIPPGRKHVKGQNLQLQDQVFERLERELASLGYSDNTIADSYEKAADLISSNIQSLANNYPAVRNKYLTLIKTSFTPALGSLNGLNTSAIAPTTDPIFDVTTNVKASSLKFTDLRSMADENIEAYRMAQNFALMELLTDRLSTNFSMTFSNINRVPLSGTSRVNMNHDQHYTGAAVSTYITTLYYRAFLSCITEFVDFLKAKNIFEHSVIHIASEFNRIPRNDGSGADHGIAGSNATLISGKFASGNVIGNIKVDGSGRGTWGEAAPFKLDGDTRPIHVNDVARTITAMLGVDDVATNGYSLLKPSGKLWVPKRVEAKNVF